MACARNREYLVRKWATSIASHQPPPQPGQADAVDTALLRAREFAAACEAGSAVTIPADVPHTPGIEAGAGDEVERHYRLSRELHDAIVVRLEADIESHEYVPARYRRMKVVRICTAKLHYRQAFSTLLSRFFRPGS